MAQDQQNAGKLLAWPWRVVVFIALAGLALLAIRIMDGHALKAVPTAAAPATSHAAATQGR
jgi:hypothetical protein